MIEFKSQLKRWGRSFGIVVPMDKLKKANIGENEIIEVSIIKQQNPLKKHFGKIKFKRPIEEILNDGNRESWDE